MVKVRAGAAGLVASASPDHFPPSQEDNCPQFLDPSPLVIPMNHETEVTFQGKNLDTVKVGESLGPSPAFPNSGPSSGDRAVRKWEG